MKLRSKYLGISFGYTLFRGMNKMGKAVNLEPIYREHEKKEQEFFNIGFRNFGIIAWIKYYLLGRYEHIILDPKVISLDKIRHRLYIDPKAYIIHDSGVWSLSTLKDTGFVNELNLKNDFENTQGFFSDWLRRMAVQDVGTALITEKMRQQSELEEKAKSNRIKRFESGG